VSFDQFPVLTKRALMQNFDEIVTDTRLTLRSLETHLDGADPGAMLFDEYRVAATGGTTGERAVIVYDRQGWESGLASAMRYMGRDAGGSAFKVIGIGASSAIHLSGRIYEAMQARHPDAPRLTLRTPIADVVATLNSYQPDVLMTYPSFLRTLAQEQREGRLKIHPKVLYSGAEALTPELRDFVRETWGIEVGNRYNSTETFASASECEHFNGVHLPEDLVVYESVDAANKPVGDDQPGEKLLITTLCNRALPLIRYEMTDMVRKSAAQCPCGQPYARFTAISGRREEVLTFSVGSGSVRIHAGQFSSPLIKMPGLRQFQFKTAGNGIRIDLAVRDPGCSTAIASDVEQKIRAVLMRHGVVDARIEVSVVDAISRLGNGEKERLVAIERSSASS
jgi:phenylacetate-coenzyme A ligase PaaK-like adenylate-forming protein